MSERVETGLSPEVFRTPEIEAGENVDGSRAGTTIEPALRERRRGLATSGKFPAIEGSSTPSETWKRGIVVRFDRLTPGSSRNFPREGVLSALSLADKHFHHGECGCRGA